VYSLGISSVFGMWSDRNLELILFIFERLFYRGFAWFVIESSIKSFSLLGNANIVFLFSLFSLLWIKLSLLSLLALLALLSLIVSLLLLLSYIPLLLKADCLLNLLLLLKADSSAVGTSGCPYLWNLFVGIFWTGGISSLLFNADGSSISLIWPSDCPNLWYKFVGLF